jgi:hypothetical protein
MKGERGPWHAACFGVLPFTQALASQEENMAANTTVDTFRVRRKGAGLFIDVSWANADAVQAYLNRCGVCSTVILDALEHQASLELWPCADEWTVRAALAGWAG